MPGPYFKDQQISPCGCFYPDVTRIGSDLTTAETILYCIIHEEYRVAGSRESLLRHRGLREPVAIPSDEWREGERRRLRGEPSTPPLFPGILEA